MNTNTPPAAATTQGATDQPHGPEPILPLFTQLLLLSQQAGRRNPLARLRAWIASVFRTGPADSTQDTRAAIIDILGRLNALAVAFPQPSPALAPASTQAAPQIAPHRPAPSASPAPNAARPRNTLSPATVPGSLPIATAAAFTLNGSARLRTRQARPTFKNFQNGSWDSPSSSPYSFR